MPEVHLDRLQGIGLHGPVRVGGGIEFQQFAQRQGLRRRLGLGRLSKLAVGEQEGGDVGLGRDGEPAALGQSDVLFQPQANGLGVGAAGGLDGLFELPSASAEADLEAS